MSSGLLHAITLVFTCFWECHMTRYTKAFPPNLVPRLPRSGTRTLKLCRLGIFSHVRGGKGRKEVERTQLCVGVPATQNRKRPKVVGNLLHISSYRALNNIHTERWSIVGWTTRKMLPFCFGPILLTSCLRREDTRLSARYIFVFQESLGMRLISPKVRFVIPVP